MSQSLYKIGKPTIWNLGFLFSKIFFFYRQQKCQVLVGHNFCPVWNMELDYLMN